MLAQLYIQNIAVIQKASIDLEPGLNIFTGETGAGKTILISALSALLGARVSKDIIRTGANKALVSALFTRLSKRSLDFWRENGFELEEDGLLITREISIDGRSTCKIAGQPATLSLLRQLGESLLDLHGQHDNLELFRPERHLAFVDEFADLAEDIAAYRADYQAMTQARDALERLSTDDQQKNQRIDLLTYQIAEIEAAELRVGEEEDLDAQREVIRNAQKITDALSQACYFLNGSDDTPGAVSLLGEANRNLDEVSGFLEEAKDIVAKTQAMEYELQEYAGDLYGLLEQMEFDPVQLEQIEERLDLIHRLKRKYGNSVEEILDYLSHAKEELDAITFSEEKIAALQKELALHTAHATEKAKALSKRRQEAAKQLVAAVEKELTFLDMPSVKLCMQCTTTPLGSNGMDAIEFLISTNPGLPPKPKSKIASGGEISRVMLSIKNVLATKEENDTMIFDEVDTGVSGRAADKIGFKLKQAAYDRQILCVTHLAQVAAYGDYHLLIAKHVTDGETFTEITPLAGEARIREIARMISGDHVTEAAMQNASEMLEIAQKAR